MSRTYLNVGCYTAASPIGIHQYEVADDGSLSALGTVDTVENASFLAANADATTLYAVSETDDSGTVLALRISPSDGSLVQIDRVPSHGSAPCHVSTDADHLFVANYGTATVAAYALEPDGRFGPLVGRHRHEGSGPHPRQTAPHAHCIVPAPTGPAVYSADLGTDRIIRYERDAHGGPARLRYVGETVMAPGSGPRHLTFHPTRPIVFALCELDCTLVVLDVDEASGRLSPRPAVSTLPEDAADGSIAAEVCVHPDGHRVYVSNRGHDSIATFAFEATDETPTMLGLVSSGGRTPRHFAIHPSGRSLFVANQDSDTVVSFALDEAEGIPRQIGVVAEVSQPACVTFVEVGR